jgi:site-specific recombinase XerD
MPSAPTSALQSSAADLDFHARGFELTLASQRKRPNTIKSYLEAVERLDAFLAAKGMPRAVENLRREHVESFIRDQSERFRPATAANRYRSLQQFFKWLLEEGQIKVSPMANMKPPAVPVEPPPVLVDDQLRALLKACAGSSFEARRDKAIVLVLLDTGVRLSELAGMRLVDVHEGRRPHPDTIDVTGKGDKRRPVPLGRDAATALHWYRGIRAKHHRANETWLWLGLKGRLTTNGVAQMLRRRGAEAGIDHLNPHRFRHSFAHSFLASGGQEGDLMRLAGWSSRTMLSRYGASAATERAIAAHAEHSPADRLSDRQR